jgi:3-oxoadipate CoA-transferase alpha subunit
MIDKFERSLDSVFGRLRSGSSVFVGGFGSPGCPFGLLDALARSKLKDLTIIANNGGTGTDRGISLLLRNGQVTRLICSYPRSRGSVVVQEMYRNGLIDLEVVPQGTLAERIRAAGAGIGAFYTRTSAGTVLAEGKETRNIDGDEFVLEYALRADVALIKAYEGDRWGNLIYRGSGRNYGPIMAAGAAFTIAEVEKFTYDRPLDPERVHTPGIYVKKIVEIKQ